MARSFHRKRQSHPIAEINVTNLIDLGFTLLIIFMIAAQYIAQEQSIHVQLPVESKSQQAKPDPADRFETVSVDTQGRYYLNGQRTAIPVPELRLQLLKWSEEKKPPVVRIRGDGEATLNKLVQLWDELKKAKLTRIMIDTETAK
jgi:biopolymer transport protein ExbD